MSDCEVDEDSIRITRFDADPQDLTATVDPDELVVSGRVSFYYPSFDREKKTTHSFRVRQSDEETYEVTIRDHGDIL